jgi:hypothetical protein
MTSKLRPDGETDHLFVNEVFLSSSPKIFISTQQPSYRPNEGGQDLVSFRLFYLYSKKFHKAHHRRKLTMYLSDSIYQSRLLTRKTYEMQMFHMSSMKMGLDQAVLQGIENSGGKDIMSKEDVEKLLKHGAYDIFKEDKDGAC